MLLKSVVQSIPTYTMSCFILPDSLVKDIEAACARFWWGSSVDHKKVHWKKNGLNYAGQNLRVAWVFDIWLTLIKLFLASKYEGLFRGQTPFFHEFLKPNIFTLLPFGMLLLSLRRPMCGKVFYGVKTWWRKVSGGVWEMGDQCQCIILIGFQHPIPAW